MNGRLLVGWFVTCFDFPLLPILSFSFHKTKLCLFKGNPFACV